MGEAAAWTEEMFRALTMHSGDIISLLDGEGRLLFNSEATLRINGFTPEDLQDRDTFELIHPDDRAEVGKVFAHVLATPGAVSTVEYRYLTKDGRWLWMEAVASNQLDNPAVRGVVANSRDISERKRAEAERRALEDKLLQAQKLESLGMMAGGVAHDFNNLLAIILSEANILQRRPDRSPAAIAESAASIALAAERAADLTRQLLAYAGHSVAPLEPTDLCALVLDVAPLLQRASRGAATVAFELDDDVPPVVCNRDQLRQVLLNLVINAMDAMNHQGGVLVRLGKRTVTAAELEEGPLTAGFEPGDSVVLEVVDRGIGIAREALTRIFDPFFSTKQPGRGLGLATVSGIVRSHRAALRVETSPGAGSTFSLFFTPSAAAPARARITPPERFRGRALVIDDEPQVATAAARALSELGLECTTVTSAAEAVETFCGAPDEFALVVCDMLMPGEDGPTTVARLRALKETTRVLFVSGYAPVADALVRDEKTAFLAKPFSLSSLTEALEQLVPRARVA